MDGAVRDLIAMFSSGRASVRRARSSEFFEVLPDERQPPPCLEDLRPGDSPAHLRSAAVQLPHLPA
ncbi:MAG: hypothetical protein AB9869_24810 [Verrucomicrobiia bacterium]